jgi:HK97 family phage major capsid protein
VQTRKLALLTSVSNEALTGGNGSDLLGEGVTRAMTNGADQIFLSNPGDNGEPVGLALIPGQTTIANADVETDGLSPILDAIAQVTDLGANVSSLLMRYSVWARLQALTAADGRPIITPDVAQAANPLLFGKPVTLSPFVPADCILVNDSANLVASASEVGVATSTDALFEKDMTMMRATMRLGFGLVKPERNGVIKLKPKA